MKYTLLIIIFLASGEILFCQNVVKFKVSAESETPLVGATVVIENSSIGAITDADGIAFFDNLPDGNVIFKISFVGYEENKMTLSFPKDNNKIIKVVLKGNEEELGEVFISATRSSRTIQDIPTRIEAITAEELGEKAAMNSSNIGMLLQETTGVQMQQTSLSSGNLSIRIQGLDGRYTQILQDGFPLYGGFAGGLSIMQIPPLDLKQVELIKGSNSTLYGGGAIAGLVNLVSITPTEIPRFDIMLNQTSAIGSAWNIFYAQKYDKTGLSIYASGNNQKAYDPDNDGFSNMPESKTFNLNPKFYYYIAPETEFYLGINTSIDNRTGGDMELIKGNPDEDHIFSEENNSERYSTQLSLKNSNVNRTIAVKNSIGYFNRRLTIPDYQFKGNQLSSFSEILYNLHKDEERDWQFGLNYYFEKFAEENAGMYPVRDYSQNTFGAFIQNTTVLPFKLTLESGLRTDYNTDYGTFILPRFSILFKANSKLSFRLGGAKGYKLPTIFTEDAERFYYRNISPISIDLIEPEKSTGGNFDVNYKTALSDNLTFSINQMFFITQLKNALVLRDNSTSNGYFFENADGNILSSGFETNVKFTFNNLKFYFNYAFINTELKYDNIFKQKPLTPKHTIGMVSMYEIEDKWSAGYELYYTGIQIDESYASKPDYWTMGFMVMRYFKRITLFINFENFTNVIQTDFEPLVQPPTNNPKFSDIWSPTDGFVFNAGFKLNIFK